MTRSTKFYRLRAVTNLHVGSGDTNYGLIDKLVERDAATGFPCVNSSGMKGAIKQRFSNLDGNVLKTVFGSDVRRNREKKDNEAKVSEDTAQGACDFLPAQLLAMPVRSDVIPFFLGTSPSLINGLLQAWKDFHGTAHDNDGALSKAKDHQHRATAHNGADLGQTNSTVQELISDESFKSAITTLLGTTHPVVILPDTLMIELTDDFNLPVIARNSLIDGQSNNLWYEQVVPRESIFYFPIIWDKDRSAEFDLTTGTLQVGGNASVGYGFTKITALT